MPTPGVGQVLIKVAAAGVNRPDVLQRKGLIRRRRDISELPGLEVSGEIVAVGDGVRSRKVGDPVMALLNGGGYCGIRGCRRGRDAGDPGRAIDGRSSGHTGDVLHRLAQRVRARRSRQRRLVPRAWRHQRDRRDGHSARQRRSARA